MESQSKLTKSADIENQASTADKQTVAQNTRSQIRPQAQSELTIASSETTNTTVAPSKSADVQVTRSPVQDFGAPPVVAVDADERKNSLKSEQPARLEAEKKVEKVEQSNTNSSQILKLDDKKKSEPLPAAVIASNDSASVARLVRYFLCTHLAYHFFYFVRNVFLRATIIYIYISCNTKMNC